MSTQEPTLDSFDGDGEARFEDVDECQYVGTDGGRAIDPDAVGRFILNPEVCRGCFGDRSLFRAKQITREQDAELWTNKGSSKVHFHGDSDA